jgi:hypothetical protein
MQLYDLNKDGALDATETLRMYSVALTVRARE